MNLFMQQERTRTFSGRYAEIRRICDFVGDGAAQAGFGEDAIFQVQLACDEACTNVIEHTYKDEGKGEIIVGWAVRREHFVITIRDHGAPFDPGNILPPPHLADNSGEDDIEIQVGGLGVHFMRKLMDEVSFSYQKGGNVLVMKKQLPSQEET